MPESFEVASSTVTLLRGDITFEESDAIVNAANGTLLGGSGVDGAIHRMAGPRLLEACKVIKSKLPNGTLATGGAVITPGFGLRAKHVIHCVGPMYDIQHADAPELLASCYREALRVAREHRLESVSFPSISTGVYRYPAEKAAPVALRTVRDSLLQFRQPATVRFVLFDDRTLSAYLHAARAVLRSPSVIPGA